MSPIPALAPSALQILQRGGVFVPSPLALDAQNKVSEPYQRLLTLYYIKAGAKAVIPAAHTGEFALDDVEVFTWWLRLVKEMTQTYGRGMLTMAAIGGRTVRQQAEIAAAMGYDMVMVAPTAFAGKQESAVISLLSDLAGILPVFGFELQQAIPGSYIFSKELWQQIFNIAYGAKGASFDTYRSINMLEAAAWSLRKEELALLTGNDDRIVADLFGKYNFKTGNTTQSIRYSGGLLGHFATDTRAAVEWVQEILTARENGCWQLPLSREVLAHAVNHCNMVLFDALGNFENSVWGVKYRLTRLGLLPGPYCYSEKGRRGQAAAIDRVYGAYPQLTDDHFLTSILDEMKREVGLTSTPSTKSRS